MQSIAYVINSNKNRMHAYPKTYLGIDSFGINKHNMNNKHDICRRQIRLNVMQKK